MTDRRRADVVAKIAKAVDERRPLTIVVPFGGYKHFWNESAPTVDYAEMFHIDFMVRNLLSLSQFLPGGVRIEYVSEDFLVPYMDNYSPQALDSYAQSFRKVVDWFDERTPEKIRISFWRLSEEYDTDAILRDVQDSLPCRVGNLMLLATELRDQALVRSRRSVNWSGWEDWSQMNDEERFVQIVRARAMEMAFSDIGFIEKHVGLRYIEDLNVCAVFSWGMSSDNEEKQFLTLHSADGVCVDHWIGRGILIDEGDGIRSTILSRTQYEAASPMIRRYEVCGLDLPDIQTLHEIDVLVRLHDDIGRNGRSDG